MDATQLRIGNYLMAAEKEYYGKKFRIDAGDIKHIREGMKNYKYLPVEITPEILEACGFTKQRDNSYALECLVLHKDSCWWYSIDATYIENDDGTQWREIKFLHQLQNLYYALTSKEIEYQP